MATATLARTTMAPLPLDVRLMNVTAARCSRCRRAPGRGVAVLWLVRQPFFAIRAISVDGDVAHNSVVDVRANAAPQLAGNFFTLDLARRARAFEAVPWVRQAVVRRVWPNRLRVQLEEHRPVALWGSDERRREAGQQLRRSVRGQRRRRRGRRPADARRARRQLGAGAGDVRPRSSRCSRRSTRASRRCALSGRGSLAGDARHRRRVELGRGSDDEVLARAQRFVAHA